jgi:Domain of unknown function (DUF4783)
MTMKILFFALIASIHSLSAQPNFNQVAQALKQANLPTLATYWDEQVEITIADTDGFYSSIQATDQLSNFFKLHKPTDCQVVHYGTARDKSSHYFIGTLVAGGKKFRIYVLLKSKIEKFLIQEMRIENE